MTTIDLTEVSELENKYFQDCELQGPAVLVLEERVIVVDNYFNDPPPVKIVNVKNCVFTNCTFRQVTMLSYPAPAGWFQRLRMRLTGRSNVGQTADIQSDERED